MKGRKTLRRAGIFFAFVALLSAGMLASGALGMTLEGGSSTDSSSTATETAPPTRLDDDDFDVTSTSTSTDTSSTSTDATTSTETTTTRDDYYDPGSLLPLDLERQG